jgi:parvulin-like peptidyl-prolyl isomerase
MIKKLLYILSFSIIFVNDLSFAKEIKIIAKIDNQIITNIDLEDRYNMSLFLAQINPKSQKQKEIIKDQILEQMINEKLQLIDIQKNQITDNEIEQKIEQIISNNNLNLEKISRKKLALKQYREQIKIKILFSQLVKNKISPQIKIKNSAINDILEINNIKKEIISFKISEIYLAKSDNSAKIAKIFFTELQDGADFKKLSKEFSNLYDDILLDEEYWVGEGELHPKLYQEIVNLEQNQISNPVELNGDYYIFKIIDKKFLPNIKIDNLDEIEDIIFRRELNLAIKSYILDLRKNSNIKLF